MTEVANKGSSTQKELVEATGRLYKAEQNIPSWTAGMSPECQRKRKEETERRVMIQLKALSRVQEGGEVGGEEAAKKKRGGGRKKRS